MNWRISRLAVLVENLTIRDGVNGQHALELCLVRLLHALRRWLPSLVRSDDIQVLSVLGAESGSFGLGYCADSTAALAGRTAGSLSKRCTGTGQRSIHGPMVLRCVFLRLYDRTLKCLPCAGRDIGGKRIIGVPHV